jgi:hypothetical protein
MLLLARLAYVWWVHREVDQLLAAARHAASIQSEVLLARLRAHAESALGKDYGFAEIRSVAEFRRRMPITTYVDYAPYVERVKRGELSAMFNPGAEVLMFALTSGTTSEAKYIPITREFFGQYRRGWNIWGRQAYYDHTDLCWKKHLTLASDWQQFFTSGGIPCGNISGLAAESAPRVGRSLFIIPPTLIKISNTTAKQYTALRLALADRNVGIISTANPSTLVTLARLADARRESLIRDLHDGTLAADVEVPQAVRERLATRISRPARARARELEKIVARTGHLYPRDYWPKLSVLGVWLGGSVGAYLPRLKEYYGQTALRDHGLSASEGRMTLPLEDGTTAGLLEFMHHYFEFIPEEEHDRPGATVLEAHELEVGKNYYIVLTTASGFFRYDIHDVVRCVGYQGEAPLLEFMNKGASFSNITGEKLSEFQVVSAVTAAFNELALPIETFTLAPTFSDPPRYVLLVEEGAVGERRGALANSIERHMEGYNCEYANRQQTGRLGPLEVRELRRGTWAAYRQQRIGRVGGSLEQYKHPCLTSDLEFVGRVSTLAPAEERVAIAH